MRASIIQLLVATTTVFATEPGIVYYEGGLEVTKRVASLAAPVEQAPLRGAALDIAKDVGAIAREGLTRNNTASVIRHAQVAGTLSDAEMDTIWAAAHNGGLAVLTDESINGSLALDLQSISKYGLTAANGASLMNNVQSALDIGTLVVKDGAALINAIRAIIKNPNLSNGASIVDAIQTLIMDAAGLFDANPKVCRRQGVGRGTPAVPQCLPGEESYGALCYPKCKEGYEAIGCCICRKKGCSGVDGVTDIGVSCTKPAAYGRGSGYAIWNEDKCNKENAQGCEKNGAMWYPKCGKGFHNVGCCICSPDCPSGTTDDGAYCRKDSYGRGVGVSRLGCDKGLDKSGLFCYPPCAANQTGVGPLCWPHCVTPASVDCGLFCTSTVATCVSTTVDIVGASAKITLSLVAQDYTGAIASAVQIGGKYFNLEQCPK
uniref:Secreted protein n=1 Tax=Achlya hypogyna TaxID=1202772 RepID=A0A0A7CN18_ACHHY|nr:secreted protein [Achlya hypogyna]